MVLVLVLTLENKKAPVTVSAETTFRERIAKFDLFGTAALLPGVTCLLLALQWGGTTYAWSNGRTIALLVLTGVLIITFIAVQIWKGDAATLPPRIAKNRSVAAGFLYSTCVGSSMITMAYFLPLWFQAIQGVSAVESGIRTLPFVREFLCLQTLFRELIIF